MSMMLVLALALQETLPPDITDPLPGARCCLGAHSIARGQLRRVAQSHVAAGRYEAALETYLEAIRVSGDVASPALVVGAVNVAVRLGRVTALIDAISDRPRVIEEVVVHLQALRFRGKGDILGILQLVIDRGRADRFGNYRETHPDSGVDLLLEIVDLGASLGPGIIEPLRKRMAEDPTLRPWVTFIIAGLRTPDIRWMLEAERTGLEGRMMKIYHSDPRVRVFDHETLRVRGTMSAIEEGIRAASRRLGQSPPDGLARVDLVPIGFTAAWMSVGIAAVITLLRRLRVARPLAQG